VNALMDLLTQSREESLQTPGRPQRSHQDHRRILDAIRRRDEVASHRAVVDHLIAVERLVMGTQSEDGGTPPPESTGKRKSPAG
jgi:GntR family transcriptional regulator, transcriptional repressor for pyruvate dehydrogenase complex